MPTIVIALFTALATACLPLFIRYIHHPQTRIKGREWWLTSFAAFCMAVSVFLPDIHISNQTHTFQQHFVGGGMYTACLFIYATRLLDWHRRWFIELPFLFAWVSAFGVGVEILEFVATQIGIVHLANADTDWDLLANTLGAFAAFFITKVVVKHTD